jgi:hypothetical protein
MAAWTAHTLLDCAVGSGPRVDVTLHRVGDLSAAVAGARLTWPATARLRPLDELVGQRMWWHQLTRAGAVTVCRDGGHPGPPAETADELVWHDLDIVTRLEFDVDLIGVASGEWWREGPARLQNVFATRRFRLPPGHRVVIADEASRTVAHVSFHDLEGQPTE